MERSQTASERASAKRRIALHMSKRQAIATFDFESAEVLHQQLAEERKHAGDGFIRTVTEKFVQEVREYVRVANTRTSESARESEESLRGVSNHFHRLFTDMKSQQLAALSHLESEYADMRIWENERRVPEQVALLEEAKRLALDGRFEEAREKRDESRDFTQKEIKRRLDELDKRFVTDIAKLATTQGQALEDLNQRFVAAQEQSKQQAEDKENETATFRDEKIKELFEGAKAKLTNAAQKEKVHQRAPGAFAQDLWTELDRECTDLGISNPVPSPVQLARAEKARKSAAQSRMSQSVAERSA
jgi:hypothetical protein